MIQTDRIYRELRAWPLFSNVPDSALQQYVPLFQVQRLRPGDYLHFEGDGADYFYLIRKGRVKVTRTSSTGKMMIVGFYGRGDFLGCCCVLPVTKLPCTTQAVDPTEVLRLSREAFLSLLSEHGVLAMRVVQETIRRLRDAHRRMESLALDQAEQRVITALLELYERFGVETANGTCLLPSRITRLDLAEMAGTTLETTSRIMSKLKRAGWLTSSKEGIVLFSTQALAQFAYPK